MALDENRSFLCDLDKNLLERGLPPFVQHDIDALLEGIEANVGVLDCLYNELQGSINSAFYGSLISNAQAVFLRKKYLGWEEPNLDL